MSTNRSGSLTERNRARMAAGTTQPSAQLTAVPTPEPDDAAAGAPPAGEKDPSKVGISLPAVVLVDSRSAYVADLDDHVDPALSHAQWIETAARAHVQRSITERQDVEAKLPALAQEEEAAKLLKRGWFLSPAIVSDVDLTVATERAEGHLWRSRSSFIATAMRVAIEAARDRRGGTLPEAPKRLPNKPTFQA